MPHPPIRIAVAAALATATLALASSAAAAPPATVADALATNWADRQNGDGSFPDSLRPQPRLGPLRGGRHGLRADARRRAHRPRRTGAGRRPRAALRDRAAPGPRLGLREHADRLGLQPAPPAGARHARLRPAARGVGGLPAHIGPLFDASIAEPTCRRTSTSSRRCWTSSWRAAGCAPHPRRDAQRPRRGAPPRAHIDRPARAASASRMLRGGGRRPAHHRALGPLRAAAAYHALMLGFLARAIDLAGRRARTTARASRCGPACARPGPSRRRTATSPTSAAARVRRGRSPASASRRSGPAAAAATARRAHCLAVGGPRDGAHRRAPPDRPERHARGAVGERPRHGQGDRRVRERRRLQRPHADHARLGRRRHVARPGCTPGRLLADRARSGAASRSSLRASRRPPRARLDGGQAALAAQRSPRRVRPPRAQVPRRRPELGRSHPRRADRRGRARLHARAVARPAPTARSRGPRARTCASRAGCCSSTAAG